METIRYVEGGGVLSQVQSNLWGMETLRGIIKIMHKPAFNRIYEEWKPSSSNFWFHSVVGFNRIYEEWKRSVVWYEWTVDLVFNRIYEEWKHFSILCHSTVFRICSIESMRNGNSKLPSLQNRSWCCSIESMRNGNRVEYFETKSEMSVQSNLWGMETDIKNPSARFMERVQSNLWGMET